MTLIDRHTQHEALRKDLAREDEERAALRWLETFIADERMRPAERHGRTIKRMLERQHEEGR